MKLKMYKHLLALKNMGTNNPDKNGQKNLNRPLTKEDTQMAKGHVKRHSTPHVSRKMHIKQEGGTILSPVAWPQPGH